MRRVRGACEVVMEKKGEAAVGGEGYKDAAVEQSTH